jgi:AraC-like DNA-binding protein
MDLLADLIKQAGLRGRIIHQRIFSQPSLMTFPCAKSFGFHVVTQGRAFIHSSSLSTPIELNDGDVALMARGCDHQVSTQASDLDKIKPLLATDPFKPEKTTSAQKPLLTIISGAYQVWNTPVHPFFHELPQWHVLRANELDHFDEAKLAVRMLSTEASHHEVGSQTICQALLDIIFTHIIRKTLMQCDLTEQTWGRALHNESIKKSIELIHEHFSHEWTLEELARQVGLSRSGFAQKFKQEMGKSALQYLTTVRVQNAMYLLTETPNKLESISLEVGYKDAFSFSKVFKKVTGVSPKEYRLANALPQQAGVRFF